ncbi:DUF484 family protein [Porticoccus sp.]|uniref:DUF484 family protein n=1 Tax=Porticoccus sp. TaxID=2024853 RepID=UPI003F695386
MSTEQKKPHAKELLILSQIKAHLEANPRFFEDHPDLLEVIELPHDSGPAISLIERQVSVLRERNLEMRQRLNAMLDSAKINDKLFEKTKRLILTLLEARDLETIVNATSNSLSTDFQVQFHSMILFGDNPSAEIKPHVRMVNIEQANDHIGTLLRTNRAICGVLGSDELTFLFGNQAEKVGSVAAVPLAQGSVFGVLAIGHADPNYYRSSMGTLFLSYIAEVLNRIIPRLLP